MYSSGSIIPAAVSTWAANTTCVEELRDTRALKINEGCGEVDEKDDTSRQRGSPLQASAEKAGAPLVSFHQ